jgi:hypothetical protein
MNNPIINIYKSFLGLRRLVICVAMFVMIVSRFVVIGGIRVEAQDLTSKDTTPIFENGQYVQTQNCELYYEVKSIKQDPFGKEIGFCVKQDKNNIPVFFYGCKVSANDGTSNDRDIPTGNILVECSRRVGTDSSTKSIRDCVKLQNDSGVKITGLGTADKQECKKYFSEFCANSWDNTNLFSQSLVNGEGSSSFNLCTKYLGFTEKPQIAVQTESAANVTKCTLPTDAELKEFEKNTDFAKDKAAKLYCKEAQGTGIYRCDKIDYAGDSSGTKCVAVNKAAKDSALKTTKQTGQDNNPITAATGGIFTLIYQIVAAIIMALLFLVRYLQMMILLLFISVMTVLLNLSPNTGFLTTLAVPLWSIFAQIASLGAVGILIFLGSATMIGIEGFEYTKTIERGAKVAIYVFVSNFTYFGLAFAISLLDGFTKLIVFVFGGGSVFKLFEALIASVSSISKIKNQTGGWALIPDVGNGLQAIGGTIFGKGAGDITTNLVGEIIVVIGLGLIIWVFGRIFFMLLTRVAILLLLLITSPIWVLGILVKDSLPSQLQGQVDKAVSLVSGTIVFNFAFITTLVLVTIITQKINGGISEFQKTIVANFEPATNTGLAFIDGVSANAQSTSGVLSSDAFLGFGAGGFGDTISVCAVLGINLAIIYFAFDSIANLIDTNIQSVGKAVGGAVGKNLQNFRNAKSFKEGIGMMGQDAFKYGKMAVTGNNELIADGAGAGLKFGNQVGKGTVGVARYSLNPNIRANTNAKVSKYFTDGNERLADIRRNPIRSLTNTIRDRTGLSNRQVNQDMIDDYNKKKLKNRGKTLTIEEEQRQKERLELAKKFEEDNINNIDERNLQNAKNSNDPTQVQRAEELESAKAVLDASVEALKAVQEQLKNTNGQLAAFTKENGSDASKISPDKARILNTLKADKQRLETNQTVQQANVNIGEITLGSLKEQMRSTEQRYSVAQSRLNIASSQSGLGQIDEQIKKAEDGGKRSFAGNIDNITGNASEFKKGIDKMATSGKKKYEYETTEKGLSSVSEQLEESNKKQAEREEKEDRRSQDMVEAQREIAQAQRDNTEALNRLFNSRNTPPNNPPPAP